MDPVAFDLRRAAVMTGHHHAEGIASACGHRRVVRGNAGDHVFRRLAVGQDLALGSANTALKTCGKRGNPKPPSATEQPEKTPTE